MASLEPHLARVLIRIVEADGGANHRFQPFFSDAAAGPVLVDPPIDGATGLLLPGPMLALARLGYLDISPATSADGEYGPFQLTTAGREAAARYAAPDPAGTGHPVDLSWERVRPVLVAAVQEWERAGAGSPIDVADVIAALGADADRVQVWRALEMFERDLWVTSQYEMGTDGPIAVTPLPKALGEARGWPTQTSDVTVITRLMAALDQAVERTDDPEEKTRLQALRSAAGDVSKTVLAGAILAAGKVIVGA